jgi:hypothetical protein
VWGAKTTLLVVSSQRLRCAWCGHKLTKWELSLSSDLFVQNRSRRWAVAASIPPDIRRYLDGLLFVAGQRLGRAEYEALLHDLFGRLNRFILLAYLNSLSADSRAVFDRMVVDERPADELEQFIHDRVPDLPQVHANALRAFRRDYLREVARARRRTHTTENSR